jgi:uncharacterized membrane protein YbhN (UPF0104 family)
LGVVVVVLGVLIWHYRAKLSFDWPTFFAQLRHASVGHVLVACGLVIATYYLRSMRWAVFLSPVKKVGAGQIVGSQFIGFTAVALFGRLADLTRPYLVSKRVGLSLESQIAVYTIERIFDLGAAAVLFSGALALTPANAPHHEVFVRAGIVSLAGTAFLVGFAVVVRVWGDRLARVVRGDSGGLREAVAVKVLGFREGLNAIASAKELVVASLLSLAMWGMIGEAYVQTAHAFVHVPELAALSYSQTMLLMAASMGGSLLQLPVIGWFTQIAVTAAAMHGFYGAPIEAATACGGVLLIVTWLVIIPFGLVWARVEGVKMRELAEESKGRE